MTDTTVNRMNILIQKGSARINAKVSAELKRLLVEAACKMNMSESQYIKLAIAEKLIKEQ